VEAAEEPRGHLQGADSQEAEADTSDRELYRRLCSDEELREICDIEEKESPYDLSQLTRFRSMWGRIGSRGL